MKELIISPKTKIYDLLEAYPELEDELIKITPVFKKLKNPVLRRTITRVTSLQQAANVGEVPVEEIINRFREIVGADGVADFVTEETGSESQPDWFQKDKIVSSFNAEKLLNEGGHPLDTVLRESQELGKGEIYELITPFYPAPLIDKIKERGLMFWGEKVSDTKYCSYFCKD